MDRQSDDLIRQILASAARLAEGRAESVIATATTEAEEEVRALVKSAVKAALLQRVSEQLQTGRADIPQVPDQSAEAIEANADVALGTYVYCIIRSDNAALPRARPIDPAYPLHLVKHEELAAVVSDVPLESFRRRVESEKDLRWLEEKVTAHNQVVQQVAQLTPVIPLQFATILGSQQHLSELLDQKRDELRRTLDTIDGQAEWGVKIFAPIAAGAHADYADSDDEISTSSGTAYMTRKQKARSRRQQTRQSLRELVQQCHNRLSDYASDVRLLQATSRTFAPSSSNCSGELLINASYLVPKKRTAQFQVSVDQLQTMLQGHQLALQLTGPWPPYNFVNLSFVATKGGANGQ